MTAFLFSNLFMASDKHPNETSMDKRFILQVDSDKNNSIDGWSGRIFIKDTFSTTIEGAMSLAAKAKGCKLDDVRYIYQIMDPRVSGVVYDMNENPSNAFLNLVDVDVTDMIVDERYSEELIRAVCLRPFCIATPKTIATNTDVPSVLILNGLSFCPTASAPLFSITLKPFSADIYKRYSTLELDGKCHRPEFLEYVNM